MRLAELPDEEPPTDVSRAASDGQCSPFYGALQVVQAEFEDRTWQAFWKAVVDEQPTAGIAEDLGMTVNAVRLAKSRVLRRLRSELEGLVE
jgi:RNA polymerase sigma-70 factor (ECF subfamily)